MGLVYAMHSNGPLHQVMLKYQYALQVWMSLPPHATHPHILPTIIYASSHLLHFFLLMPFHFHAHAQPLLTSCK